jgi:hypothetical protein
MKVRILIMLFLENVLGDLNTTANVCVMLSSYTVYGVGETENPIRMQDGCGNHRVMNWLDAMTDEDLFKQFLVESVKCEFESYMDKPQWTVVLANGKDERTGKLEYQSNYRACREAGLI